MIIDEGHTIDERCSLDHAVCVGDRVVTSTKGTTRTNVSICDGAALQDTSCNLKMVFPDDYDPRSAVTRKDDYRDTLVKRGTTLDARWTIACCVTIGQFARIDAGAAVSEGVTPSVLVVGAPATQLGSINEFGGLLQFVAPVWKQPSAAVACCRGPCIGSFGCTEATRIV